MCRTLLARNASQPLVWDPIAYQPSDEEGRNRDQQGWYRGKRLPSLDGAGVLIHSLVNDINTYLIMMIVWFGGVYVNRIGSN
jgi:hypothetical protein